MEEIKRRIKNIYRFFIKHSDLIGYILLFVFFVIMNIKMYKDMEYLIDSDMSSELVLANILAKEGRPITNSWFYSSEVRVFNTNLVFMPLFLITNNWHTVRILGIIILDLILFAGYYYLAKQLNMKHIPWIGFLILGSISKDYLLFVTLGSFYVPHFFLSFVTIGLLFSIYKEEKNKNRIIKIIMLMGVAFTAGLEGMRLIAICYLPLLITAVIYCLINEKDLLKEGKFDFNNKSIKLIWLCILIFVSSGIGYVFNVVVFPRLGISFKIYSEDLYYTGFDFDSFSAVIAGWLDDLGYQADNLPVLSKTQIVLKPLFALLFLIICISVIHIIKNRNKYSEVEYIMDIYFIVAAIVITVLFAFTNTAYINRYLLPVSVFIVFVVGIFLTNYKFDWQKWLMIFMIIIFVVFNTFFQIQYQKENNRYHVSGMLKVRDILLENECYNGYSIDHWNGHNLLTELTDGRIETWRVRDYNIYSPVIWLQPADHAERNPEGKTFFLLWKYEVNDGHVWINGDIKDYTYYEDEYRYLLIFDSVEECWATVQRP